MVERGERAERGIVQLAAAVDVHRDLVIAVFAPARSGRVPRIEEARDVLCRARGPVTVRALEGGGAGYGGIHRRWGWGNAKMALDGTRRGLWVVLESGLL
ncbi:hypothetical protein BD626DRAFT_523643 [Schizophyllum amplum]|uniref:Uncharacterized protein n=1 Tax=Schizophyllum amplum TaxID=97359 RepID=A0A550BSV3_9AGAR|nr:hypothetical protein BD626DRAFT_523643 [Auriculariopsis ampla]